MGGWIGMDQNSQEFDPREKARIRKKEGRKNRKIDNDR
jgi:hypothetical protein